MAPGGPPGAIPALPSGLAVACGLFTMLRTGDAVRIVLDTFHDHRNAFSSPPTRSGAQKDGCSTENGITNWEWNLVWE